MDLPVCSFMTNSMQEFSLKYFVLLNQKVCIDLLYLLFDQDFRYIRTFVVVVFDVDKEVDK